jgi:hypothetical protein
MDPDTGDVYSTVDVDKLVSDGVKVDKEIAKYSKREERGGGYREEENALDKQIKRIEDQCESLFNRARDPKTSPEKADKLSRRADQLLEELSTLQARRYALREESQYVSDIHYGMRMAFGRPDSRIEYVFSSSLSGANKEVAVNGLDWFTTRIGNARLPQHQARASVDVTSDPRSYCQGKAIYLAQGAPSSTSVHEMGHWLEHSRDDVRSAAIQFLERRYAKSTTEFESKIAPLSQLTGEPHFSSNEIAFRGRFVNAYSGKLYVQEGRITSTEIISMGSERLFKDPVGFRQSDPEYYHFMLGVLNHAAKRPNPAQTSKGSAPFRSGSKVLESALSGLSGVSP